MPVEPSVSAPPLSITQFFDDPLALGYSTSEDEFQLSPVQRIVLKLLYGLELDDYFTHRIQVTWRGTTQTFTEASYVEWLRDQGRLVGDPGSEIASVIMGRRSGKTTLASLIAAYEIYRDLRSTAGHLRHTVLIGSSRDQSLILKNMTHDHLERPHWIQEQIDMANTTRESTYFSGQNRRLVLRSMDVRSAPDRTRGAAVRTSVFDECGYTDYSHFQSALEAVGTCSFGIENKIVAFSSYPQNSGGYIEWHQEAPLRLEIPTWEVGRVPLRHLEESHEKDSGRFWVEYGARLDSEPTQCPHCHKTF